VVPANDCVLVDGLTQAQIAALQYQGKLQLRRLGNDGDQGQCGALVMDPSLQPTLDERVNLTHWAYRASASRLSDRKEKLLIYLRVGH
jgi:hypothetical protein